MERRAWGVGLVASLFAVAGIAACRQLVGITDNPPTDLTSTLCGLPYGTNVCASCVNTSCCTESTACAADPVCSAYESCLGTCNGDPKCRSQCTIDNPVGVAADVSALSACLATNCETACGLTCGGVADLISEPDAAVSCEQCLKGSQCAQAEACASSEPCVAFVMDFLAFSRLDSIEVSEQAQCASSAASGLEFLIGGVSSICGKNPPTLDPDASASSTAGAFAQSYGACTTPCAIGNYWACVDHVTWPSPNSTTYTFGYTVTDFVNSQPVAGALVQVCSAGDENCSQMLTQGTTDADGRVSLTFQNIREGSGLGLNGFLRTTAADIVPLDYYWGFPLVEAQLPNLSGTAISPTELQDQWNALGVAADPTRGTVIVSVADCRVQVAPGVKITLTTADMFTQAFSTTGATTSTTGQSGTVVFANVPAGNTTITATPLALGKPSSQATVTVHPGTITEALMYPTPNP
jgi:hypothetical protein